MTYVSRKNGTHAGPLELVQDHMDSIHSPHNTRKIIIKECRKSMKLHLGMSSPYSSIYPSLNNCCPITAKINTTMARTNIRFPKAPIVPATIRISMFNVCHDLASLNTRNWNITLNSV